MTTYEVTLEIRKHGAPCGTTCDLVEADDAAAAEQTAIKLWKAQRPDRTFAPLVTVQK